MGGSKGELQIRDARDGEQERIIEVTLLAYQEYAPAMPPFAWEEYKGNIVSTLRDDTMPGEKIVAERDSDIVGAVLLIPAGTFFIGEDTEIALKRPEVRLLAVPPANRGQGIAAALMRECIERARKSGATGIALHTTDLMKVAMNMYERMGFVRDPETDFHPAPDFVVKGYRLVF